MRRSPRPRKTAMLSESTHQRLSMYALTASAAGVGALALAQPAEARIVYTPTHTVIQRGHPGILPLDPDHDGITDFNVKNSWGVGSFGPRGTLSILPARQGNGVQGYATIGNFIHYASALRAGVPVGPKGRFYAPLFDWMVTGDGTVGCDGPWKNVKNRYLGLKFTIKGKTHYGWARVSASCNPQNFKISAVLTGYAYETIVNKAIITGKTEGLDDSARQAGSASLSPPAVKAGTLGLLARGSGLVPSFIRKT